MAALDFAGFIRSPTREQYAAVVPAGTEPEDVTKQAAGLVWKHARREARCESCRGYGWHMLRDDRGAGPGGEVWSRVIVCGCLAGHRFEQLCFAHPDVVLELMGLDTRGAIKAPDGIFGSFSANGREVRAWRTYRLVAGTVPTDARGAVPDA